MITLYKVWYFTFFTVIPFGFELKYFQKTAVHISWTTSFGRGCWCGFRTKQGHDRSDRRRCLDSSGLDQGTVRIL